MRSARRRSRFAPWWLSGVAVLWPAFPAAALDLAAARSWRLDNGLTVIVLEEHGTPLVSVQMLYEVGARNEDNGRTGLAHFLEHMAYRATKNFPGTEVVSSIYGLGGEWHGYTWIDQTTYFETLPKAGLDLALRIEADRMANLVIAPDEVEAERGAVLAELHGYDNDPASVLHDAVVATALLQHPVSQQHDRLAERRHGARPRRPRGVLQAPLPARERGAGRRWGRIGRRRAAARGGALRRHRCGARDAGRADRRAVAAGRAARRARRRRRQQPVRDRLPGPRSAGPRVPRVPAAPGSSRRRLGREFPPDRRRHAGSRGFAAGRRGGRSPRSADLVVARGVSVSLHDFRQDVCATRSPPIPKPRWSGPSRRCAIAKSRRRRSRRRARGCWRSSSSTSRRPRTPRTSWRSSPA